jgi:hypothetical protein
MAENRMNSIEIIGRKLGISDELLHNTVFMSDFNVFIKNVCLISDNNVLRNLVKEDGTLGKDDKYSEIYIDESLVEMIVSEINSKHRNSLSIEEQSTLIAEANPNESNLYVAISIDKEICSVILQDVRKSGKLFYSIPAVSIQKKYCVEDGNFNRQEICVQFDSDNGNMIWSTYQSEVQDNNANILHRNGTVYYYEKDNSVTADKIGSLDMTDYDEAIREVFANSKSNKNNTSKVKEYVKR